MDKLRAKEIIETLADGINPLTGEVLSSEDSCNQVEVVRALHAAVSALSAKKPRPQPENAGKPWTEEDDSRLEKMFEEGKSCKELCAYFKRSTGAIISRLVRLGKVSDRYSFPNRTKD